MTIRLPTSERWNSRRYTDTDLAEREVLLHDLEIVSASTSRTLTEDSVEYGLIRDGFVAMSRKVPLDLVLAYLPHDVELAVEYAGLNKCAAGDLRIRVARHAVVRRWRAQVLCPSNIHGPAIRTEHDLGHHSRRRKRPDSTLCYAGNWLAAGRTRWRLAVGDVATLGSCRYFPPAPTGTAREIALPDDLDQAGCCPNIAVPEVFYSQTAAELLLFNGAPAWDGHRLTPA